MWQCWVHEHVQWCEDAVQVWVKGLGGVVGFGEWPEWMLLEEH